MGQQEDWHSKMKKPNITVKQTDHEKLLQLANGLVQRLPELADELLGELERARIATTAPPDTVQMGATVEYGSDDGNQRRVTLVYPQDADIAQNKISILTPIGTALLGLAVGQSIQWTTNDGRNRVLTILAVDQLSKKD
jgi:regulator of nucleoside diphosphate kinase